MNMRTLNEIISNFTDIAANPKARLDRYLEQGKKVIGCMPYFCPEELIHASGMIPFGLWGAETTVSEARRYLPAFICSIVQTTLELGIIGAYDGISAIMIPILCDSLKSMDGNWRYGVKEIPAIPVAHAQNRKTPAGAEFTASQYRKILARLEEISGASVTQADLRASIAVYNKRNAAVRQFLEELGKRPGVISASGRNAVFKSAYFMDAEEFTSGIEELTASLAGLPATNAPPGPRLVTCGIIADNSELLEILDEYNVTIVDDLVAHESLRYRFDAAETGDPIMALAHMVGDVEGCPVLFDPGKLRAGVLVDIVRRNAADGVLFVMTKFCDPEEYDIVPITKRLEQEEVRFLQVEVDQQTIDIGRIRTAIETFCEILARKNL